MKIFGLLLVQCVVHGWTITHTGVNGMVWESQRGSRLLVDPLLVDELTFFEAPTIYRATARGVLESTLRDELLGGAFDAVVLSQGLPDHAHEPTLRALQVGSQPIVGPRSAEEAVRRSGKAKNFRRLNHLQTARVGDVTLRALPGALVGPPWQRRENSILATSSDKGLLYEPHGDYGDEALLRRFAKDVDVLIAPVTTQRLFGIFDLVKGNTVQRAVDLLHVDTVIDLPNGDVDARGLLAPLVSSEEEVVSPTTLLSKKSKKRIIRPSLGQPVEL